MAFLLPVNPITAIPQIRVILRNRFGCQRSSKARCNWPMMDVAREYLLTSIAVVVIGGTSVAGGKANVPGIWGAALFLVLLLTMLNTFGVSAGVRLLLTGLIIVGVITMAGGDKAR